MLGRRARGNIVSVTFLVLGRRGGAARLPSPLVSASTRRCDVARSTTGGVCDSVLVRVVVRHIHGDQGSVGGSRRHDVPSASASQCSVGSLWVFRLLESLCALDVATRHRSERHGKLSRSVALAPRVRQARHCAHARHCHGGAWCLQHAHSLAHVVSRLPLAAAVRARLVCRRHEPLFGRQLARSSVLRTVRGAVALGQCLGAAHCFGARTLCRRLRVARHGHHIAWHRRVARSCARCHYLCYIG